MVKYLMTHLNQLQGKKYSFLYIDRYGEDTPRFYIRFDTAIDHEGDDEDVENDEVENEDDERK